MQPAPDPEPEWLFPAEAIYAASYLFYGRAPPGIGVGEAVEWGRGRRPEQDEAASRGVWGYAIIILSVVSVVHIYRLSLSDSVAVTTERAAAVSLLPTCRPLAHGPPMCYDWERPAMAPPPPDSDSGDGDWRSHDDQEKASMDCFTAGPVRDAAARTTGTSLSLLPPTCLPFAHAPATMCYEWERPDMAPPGSDSAGDSDGDDGKAAMECFYGLVRDATKTCGYEWHTTPAMVPPGHGSGDSNWTGNDDKAIMGCFYSLVRDAVKTCFGCSYEKCSSG